MADPEANLRTAERVVDILQDHGVAAVTIGAVALAAHHYVRYTEDIDLGVEASVPKMRELTEALRSKGFGVEFHEPDGDDPLGGVIDVRGEFGLVQVVSFGGRFPAVIRDALEGAATSIRSGSPLLLAPIPQLVAMKLYAGGLRSKADIVELLRRNPEVNVAEIQQACSRYRLRGLEEILSEVQ